MEKDNLEYKRKMTYSNLAAKKKCKIVLSTVPSVINEVESQAENKGISVNAEINGMLTKYVLFLRHSEEHESVVIPHKIFSSFIDLIDEQKWIEMLNRFSVETIPSIFISNNIPMTLNNFIKHGFEEILIWAGMYGKFRNYTDTNGRLCLVFEHHYGIKWSRILAATFSNFMEKALKLPSRTEALPLTVVVVITDQRK